MATILDPLGSPETTFNQTGKAIVTLTANISGDFVDAVEIPHVCEQTFAMLVVTGAPGGYGSAKLSSDCVLGDEVTVIPQGGAVSIYYSDGSSLDTVSSGNRATYLRVTATENWIKISS